MTLLKKLFGAGVVGTAAATAVYLVGKYTERQIEEDKRRSDAEYNRRRAHTNKNPNPRNYHGQR